MDLEDNEQYSDNNPQQSNQIIKTQVKLNIQINLIIQIKKEENDQMSRTYDLFNLFEEDEEQLQKKQNLSIKQFVELKKRSAKEELEEKKKLAMNWLQETQKSYQQKQNLQQFQLPKQNLVQKSSVQESKQKDEEIEDFSNMFDGDLFNVQNDSKEKQDVFKIKIKKEQNKKNKQVQIKIPPLKLPIQQIQQQQLQQKQEFLPCQSCGQLISSSLLVAHQEQCILQYQEVPCPYCKQTLIQAFMNDHFEDCIAKIEYDFKMMDLKTTIIECSICCLNIEKPEDKCILKCQHCFHKNCIESWIQKKKECPFCRNTDI